MLALALLAGAGEVLPLVLLAALCHELGHLGSIAVAVTSILATMTTGGTLAPVSAFVATPALAGTVGILGGSTTVAAVGIAVAGGGVASLNKLRQYKVKKISKDKIQLIKK